MDQVKEEEINQYKQYSESDLKWAIDNAKEQFPDNELAKMELAYNEKVANQPEPVLEKEKTMILTKEYTGFSSLVVLCLTTGLGALSIFMYVLLTLGG